MENWDQSVKNQLEKQTPFDNSKPQPSAAAAASIGNDGTVTPNVAPNVSVNPKPFANPDLLPLEEIAAAQAALASLKEVAALLPAITADEKQRLNKLGSRLGFATQVVLEAKQSQGLLPRGIDLSDVEAEQAQYEALADLCAGLRSVLARFDDGLIASGSGYFSTTLTLYKAMRLFGKSSALTAAVQRLSRILKRPSRPTITAPVVTPSPPVLPAVPPK